MKRKILYILLFLMPLLLTQCANQVAPTGGPKDITPPEVVLAVPANRQTGFIGRRIALSFDEYVTLNNANQQVLVSPPLTNKPDIKLNNKTVVIQFKEDLKANTTYTIDFGEAIKDFHEGNVFKDYVYTFSTGDVLDTLSLQGVVLDAETKKPMEKLLVGLYVGDTLHWDSLFRRPCKEAPDFLARTDKEGRFKFQGLPDLPFLVFALEDMNANRFYDLPNEKVAFIDTLVCPSDSVSLSLSAFSEVDTTQMLLESKLVEEGLLRFSFRQPADRVIVDLSWPPVDSFQMVRVWSANQDTLNCWFTPNVLDSLRVKIQYDTLINTEKTFNLRFRETQQRRSTSSKTMKVKTNLQGKLLMPGEDFLLLFPEPIVFVDSNETRFKPVDDFGMQYRLVATDSTGGILKIMDSVFFSVRGRTHDSLSFQYQPAQESDLGNIMIKVNPPASAQVVVQLLDHKDKVLDQRQVNTFAKITFSQLPPGKYKLQAIIDTDGNGRWSPGNFHRRFLPETIVNYKDELEVKAGWDIDLDDPWSF